MVRVGGIRTGKTISNSVYGNVNIFFPTVGNVTGQQKNLVLQNGRQLSGNGKSLSVSGASRKFTGRGYSFISEVYGVVDAPEFSGTTVRLASVSRV